MLEKLRQELHQNPELSNQETKTIKIIKDFLCQNTDLEVLETGGFIYARHLEDPTLPTIAIRGDMDAIYNSNHEVYHGCGHDGHSAIIAGIAMALKGRQVNRNVILIFQAAEEVGSGAIKVLETLMTSEKIDEIYGIHNIPGYPEGTILLRPKTMACASKGMIIELSGQQSHAAYPDQGRNPAPIISELVLELPSLIARIAPNLSERLLMATIVNINVGERNFGVNAGKGELALTLRAYFQEDMERLQEAIEKAVIEKCHGLGIDYSFTFADEFPDTINDDQIHAKLIRLFDSQVVAYQLLEEPMRWSEDFGHYLHQIPGAFLGIGAGQDQPGLHLDNYEFNDKIINPAVAVLMKIIAA